MQNKDTTHDTTPAKLAAAWYCNTKNSRTVAIPGSTLVQGFRQDFHWEGGYSESKCAVSWKGALECASKEFFSEELNSWWALQNTRGAGCILSYKNLHVYVYLTNLSY